MQNDILEQFTDSANDLLGRTDQRQRLRRLIQKDAVTDRKFWQEIAAAGWLAILVPEDDGGLGLGLAEVAAVAEAIGQHLLPEQFIAAGVHACAALCALQSGAQKEELLARISAGDAVVALAWQAAPGQTAAQSASDSVTVMPTADDHIALNGNKTMVLGADSVDGWLVLASQAGSACLVWVPKETAGISCRPAMRIDGSRLDELVFAEASVPSSHILARADDAIAAVDIANDSARLAAAAELLGVARKTLALTLDYMKTRSQFGKPIGSFQALQHRAVDVAIHVELASAALTEALSSLDSSLHRTSSSTWQQAASRAKFRCTEAALQATQFAVQMHGAVGFTDECDIGLYYKRALHLGSWLGNAEVHVKRYLSSAMPFEDEDEEDVSAPSAFPRDADWDAMSEAQFRALVRGFFRQNYPDHLRHLSRRLHWNEIGDWYRTLSRQGWIAPAWPKEHGGMGLSPDKHLAFIEEQEKHGVGRMIDAGLTMAGPLLIRHGTPAQQQAYLPKIISGEHIWSQGYSEPNAGSDLASLRTDAILDQDGNNFIVNGQKTWTTMAQDSTHIFMLVRTSKTGKPQAGISFLLADIHSPGITVRPIRDLVGHEHFCEVFFDNVKVPKENLVGEINHGWSLAKALLGFERIFLGNPRQSQNALAKLHALAAAQGLFDDPLFNSKYARLLLDVEDLSALYAKYADMVKRGESLPPSVSMLKIWATETYRRIGLLLYEAGHEYGGNHPIEELGGDLDNLLTPLINSASATIYGGTNEIQRNILAKTVLGLPD